MEEILQPLIHHDPHEVHRPYEPFLAAVENGVLDLGRVMKRTLQDPLGVVLGNGRLPHHKDGGVVAVHDDKDSFLVVDHTHLVEMDNTGIQIGPSSKDAVDACDGRVTQEGLLTITMPGGLLRVVGAAIDYVKRPWLADGLRATRTVGGLAIVQFGLDALDYEVTELNAESGILTAKPRTKPH